MSIGKADCLICGKPIVYFNESQPVKCENCGKEETGRCVCEDGHYVCDACHRQKGVEHVIEVCKQSDSRNPVELAIELMRHQSIYPNGPEHHTLIGAALLTAYKNCGGDIALDKALAEMVKRSMNVPGGACGFYGTCGAAVSSGIFYCIISGSTPMAGDSWGRTQRLTSNVLGKLADVGGPRCCKRSGFTALEETVSYVSDTMGVQMEMPERIVCGFFMNIAECLKERCPYSPLRYKAERKEAVDA